MPLLDPLSPPNSLTIADSAVIMALLDSLIAKNILDKAEVQDLVKAAMALVGTRGRSVEGAQAINVLHTLWGRFCP